MNLNTQCPQCGTTFPVSPEQLQLRKGYIRCINCATIFDGFEAVVSSAPVAAAPTPVVPPASPMVVRNRQATAQPPAHSSTPIQPPARSPVQVAPYIPTEPSTPDTMGAGPVFTVPVSQTKITASQSDTDFHVGDAAVSSIEPAFRVGNIADEHDVPVASVVHRRTDPVPVEPIYAEGRTGAGSGTSGRVPSFSDTDTRSALEQAVSLLWRVAILVAGVVLVAQLVYIYRAQIAIQAPTLRPILERACVQLNCSIAYSRRIDLITIAGAGLSAQKQASGQDSSTMLLQLTLRNTYNKPQEWPTLELDLNDFSGTLQVRKNIAPDIYLTAAERQQPFAANSERVLRLPITLNGLSINGFQVRKFFP